MDRKKKLPPVRSTSIGLHSEFKTRKVNHGEKFIHGSITPTPVTEWKNASKETLIGLLSEGKITRSVVLCLRNKFDVDVEKVAIDGRVSEIDFSSPRSIKEGQKSMKKIKSEISKILNTSS